MPAFLGSLLDSPRANDIATATARSVSSAARLWNFRGLGRLFKAAGSLPYLPTYRRAVEFEPGCHFETPVFEPYWGPVIIGGRPYERDVHHIVDRLLARDVTWIDGGANLGYWSIIASGPRFRAERVVAIEPNPPTYAQLERNWELNGRRFRLEQVALSGRSGDRGRLVWADQHAIARVAAADEELPGIDVALVSIDDLMARLEWNDERPCLLKLDVEGNEIPAIEGAAALRARTDHAIIFESWPYRDYEVAAKVFGLGYRIHQASDDGRCREIFVNELPRMARESRARGPYHPENFVATAREGRFRDELLSWSRQARW